MPYIQVRTNKELTREKEVAIKKRLGEAISILNKGESWLMVEFVDKCKLYFKGEDGDNYAYVDIKIYGSSSSESYRIFTAEVSKILTEEINILPSNIYISYGEFSNWGWNGSNF